MTDPTPPPDEPLGDQARARIRADLLAAAQSGPRSAHRWIVPTAAVASVVLVAGVTAWAVRAGGGSSEGVDPLGTPSAVSTNAETQSEPSSGSAEPSPFASDPSSCEPVLDDVLAGAELAIEVPADDEDSSTSFWVAGDRFVVCDVRGGILGLRGPLPLEPDPDDRSTFRFSFTSPPVELGHPSVGVAGGIVPEGALAYDVAFTFPDGETAVAAKTTDDAGRTWWWLVHTSEGDDRGSVRVTLSLSGVQHTYTVPWGMPG